MLAAALFSFAQFATPVRRVGAGKGRPLARIMRQPIFIVSAASGAPGYVVMTPQMTSTPIAMQQCALPFYGLFHRQPLRERPRTGRRPFCVFATLAMSSFFSGVIVTTQGWTWLNYGSLLPLALTEFAILWLKFRSARPASA